MIKKNSFKYEELIDIEDKNISVNFLPKMPSGKKIKSVEVLVKIEKIN